MSNEILDALAAHVRETEEPVATASEVADRVSVGRRAVLGRLSAFSEVGAVGSKKVGAGARVFWPADLLQEGSDDVQEDVDEDPPDVGGDDPSPPPAVEYPDRRGEESPSIPHAQLDEVNFPEGKDRQECLAAVFAVQEYLEETGSASMQEIVYDVLPEKPLGYDVESAINKIDAGSRYRGAWWRKVVRPGLEAIDGVEFDESSRKWRLKGGI